MQNILIIGKPNSGKSLLFNRLTGLNQKVANFPGVTVEVKSGAYANYELIDFPGVYSLEPITKDEEVAIEKLHNALHDENNALVICNLDATRLERSLVFGLQAQELAARHKKPILFALNMIDEVDIKTHKFNLKALEKDLGSPTQAISAKTRFGLKELKEKIEIINQDPEKYIPQNIEAQKSEYIKIARSLSAKYAANADVILKNQNKIDSFLLNNFLGGVIFLFIMAFLFQSIFTWASPLMDIIEESIAYLATFVNQNTNEGMLRDFINDAILGGFGSFLVFVPQIAILTFIIGILEDSGYLARAALICHKPLSYFGLSGKSFIPYLTGHACAIPAIMAARTIESPAKRLITIMTVPLMSCSARLPVYALLISALIPAQKVFYFLDLQGLTFFALYAFGIVTALFISILITKFTKKNINTSKEMPFIIELPPYRIPHWKPLVLKSFNSAKLFIQKAGLIIFMVTITVWVLGYFPMNGGLQNSWLSQMGQLIEPVFAPLGLDWRYGVAILASFLAREVFVGTLGTLFGMEGADENIAGLAENIQADGLALGAGIGLLVFYVIALQCVSTVAVIKKETGSAELAWGAFVFYGVLAYVLAIIVKNLF